MDKYYELPDWLKGSAWELLENEGNYKIFLEGIERSGYKDMVTGKGIITVMAPNDDAFKTYLTQKGYSSISDMPIEELKKLITYHLVYYAFNQDKLANYNPNSSAPNEVGEQGMYYKFRTKSSDAVSSVYDAANKVERKIYHYERFLPVFSGYIFETKRIDAQRNYSYFYPNSNWNNSKLNEFNISNTQVDEYAVITDNGFIYRVNSVIEPLETIYNELKKSDNYSQFRQAYDRFSYFTYDESATTNFGGGDSLFLHTHMPLPPIAQEWSVSDYANLGALAKDAYTVFAPNNQAMESFFKEFWYDGDKYKTLADVNFWPLVYLLYNHYYNGSLVFPQEITEQRIKTEWGNVIEFDPNDTDKKQICVNGALYGLKEVVRPKYFDSVLQPLFKYPRFNMHMLLVDRTGLTNTLASEGIDFNLFALSDDYMTQYNAGETFMYQNLNPLDFAQEDILYNTADGWANISYSVANRLFRNHITNKLMTDVGGKKVYRTFNSFQYLMVENNSVHSSYTYNTGGTPATPKKIHDAYNGTAYELVMPDQVEDIAVLQTDSRVLWSTLMSPEGCPADLRSFAALLGKAEFHETIPAFSFLQGNQYLILAPSNDVIDSNKDKFPEEPEELAEVLKYYFVNVDASRLTDYPFPGAGVEGRWQTFLRPNASGFLGVQLLDNGNKLTVNSHFGSTANVTSFFPYIYSDGAAYIIDGLLHE
ncbi:fasciclin domain-containing protein [Alistipes sp. OttesenSCG-928-L06]|nr:fasciclin domain-containing protein [Alistipes sp. OttesenSCG-928-L06]